VAASANNTPGSMQEQGPAQGAPQLHVTHHLDASGRLRTVAVPYAWKAWLAENSPEPVKHPQAEVGPFLERAQQTPANIPSGFQLHSVPENIPAVDMVAPGTDDLPPWSQGPQIPLQSLPFKLLSEPLATPQIADHKDGIALPESRQVRRICGRHLVSHRCSHDSSEAVAAAEAHPLAIEAAPSLGSSSRDSGVQIEAGRSSDGVEREVQWSDANEANGSGPSSRTVQRSGSNMEEERTAGPTSGLKTVAVDADECISVVDRASFSASLSHIGAGSQAARRDWGTLGEILAVNPEMPAPRTSEGMIQVDLTEEVEESARSPEVLCGKRSPPVGSGCDAEVATGANPMEMWTKRSDAGAMVFARREESAPHCDGTVALRRGSRLGDGNGGGGGALHENNTRSDSTCVETRRKSSTADRVGATHVYTGRLVAGTGEFLLDSDSD
jgi:hypothetical protein